MRAAMGDETILLSCVAPPSFFLHVCPLPPENQTQSLPLLAEISRCLCVSTARAPPEGSAEYSID